MGLFGKQMGSVGVMSIGNLADTAVGALGSFAGGAINDYYARKSEKRANEEWQRRYDLQRSDALADYERQYSNFLENREYNSVGSQMQRLKDAGINPNMAVSNGQGFSSTGVSTSQVRSSSPAAPASHAGFGSMGNIQMLGSSSGMLRASEIDIKRDLANLEERKVNQQQQLIDGKVKLMQSASALNAQQAKNIGVDEMIKRIDLEYRRQEKETNIAKLQSDMELNVQRSKYTAEQLLDLQFKVNQLNPVQYEIMKSQVNLMTTQQLKLVSDIEMIASNISLNETMKVKALQDALLSYQKSVSEIQNRTKTELEKSLLSERITYQQKENAWYVYKSIDQSLTNGVNGLSNLINSGANLIGSGGAALGELAKSIFKRLF